MTSFQGPTSITSVAGPRNNPVTGKPETHKGIDEVTNGPWPGTAWNVRECTGGTVINVSADALRGKFVDVRTSPTHVERYQHMHEIYVTVGQKVPQGTVLGMAGKTGSVTGVHLHFEVLKTTSNTIAAINAAPWVNPAPWSDIPNKKGVYPGNNNIDNPEDEPAAKLEAAKVGIKQAIDILQATYNTL